MEPTETAATTPASTSEQSAMRIVIVGGVGGVAGGMSAAARARRLDENAEIVVLEQGAHVSFANWPPIPPLRRDRPAR